MPPLALAMTFFSDALKPEIVAAYSAGLVVLAIGLWSARGEVARARGLERIVALSNAFVAAPLAAFGAEHLTADPFIVATVPSFMPWRLFWVYWVGFALMAAALSIATRIFVNASGLLFAIMIFSFVAILSIPAVIENPREQLSWVLTARDSAFAGGGLILSSHAMRGSRSRMKGPLFTTGRLLIGVACLFFGVEQFLHPGACPGVPLVKQTPPWIPGRLAIGYFTAAILGVAGGGILINRKARMAATILGSWIALLVFTLYASILIVSATAPTFGLRLEGINYFGDTLLFAGVILALSRSNPAKP